MTPTTQPHFTAFAGPQRLASGPLAEVALAVMRASRKAAAEPIIIFADATGRPTALDLRAPGRDFVARFPNPAPGPETAADDTATPEPRGRGRPKLGVVA